MTDLVHTKSAILVLFYHFKTPSPPICLVISSMRSKGNGGDETGFMARDISFMGLSSAAIRFERSIPQILQRWMTAHSPFFRTQTETGSISPPHAACRSPGSLSKCWLERQYGQWFRCSLPAPPGITVLPQALQTNGSWHGCVL